MLLITLLNFFLSAQADYKLAAYNIRNFDYDVRYDIRTNKNQLAEILKDVSPDLLSVEEINQTAEFKNFIHQKFPGYDVALSECGGANGQHLGFVYKTSVFTLVKFEDDLDFSHPGQPRKPEDCTTGSRPVAVGTFVDNQNKELIAMTVHFKSGGTAEAQARRFKQFEMLAEKLITLQKAGHNRQVIMGDFNTTEFLDRGRAYRFYMEQFQAAKVKNLSHNARCSAYWWGGTEDGKKNPSLLNPILVTLNLLLPPKKK